MAISSYPTPADAGVLCVILANTAISISIFKEIFRSFLHVIGIDISSWDEFTGEPSNSAECCRGPSESYLEEFRSRTPSKQYDSVFVHECPKQECSICLNEFEPKAEINQLCCGHVFHKPCLEKWLNYWNTTCPLCRNYMIPQEADEDACPIMLLIEHEKIEKPQKLEQLHLVFRKTGEKQYTSAILSRNLFMVFAGKVYFAKALFLATGQLGDLAGLHRELGANGDVGSKLRELRANRHAVARELGVSMIPAPEGAGVRRWRAQAVVFEAFGVSEADGRGRNGGCSRHSAEA